MGSQTWPKSMRDEALQMKSTKPHIRVGIIGTGFIARGLFNVIRTLPDMQVTHALTRRPMDSVDAPPDVQLTQSLQQLIDHCDVVVECSGDVVHAVNTIGPALQAGRPVVTMDSEFHVTCGSHFAGQGYLTEAEGDQPGATAALRADAIGMGFKPLVYGNMKGYLNTNPTYEDMVHWSDKQGFSLEQTVSFTDGTKVHVEQAFVANGFGADIAQDGLLLTASDNFEHAAHEQAEVAERLGTPICDVVISGGQAPGVFVVATHDATLRQKLQNIKMGPGPYYTLVRPFHLCAIEVPKTIRAASAGEPTLLNNSTEPTIGVAAVAKRELNPGEEIKRGVGGFEVRGSAVRMADNPKHVPIGILDGAVLRRQVAPGQTLSVDDVDLPQSDARDIALQLVGNAVEQSEQQAANKSHASAHPAAR